MTWLIYKHTSPSAKSYIGQTKHSMEHRWNGHINCSQNPSNYDHFHQAIKKYGPENFIHEILEEGIETQELANEREQYWIAFYNTFIDSTKGYNKTSGGKQYEASEESIQLNKETNKKKWEDETYRNSQIQKYQSPEVKEKRSKSRKKLFQDPDYKQKMKLATNSPSAQEKRSKSLLIANQDPDLKRRKSDSMKGKNKGKKISNEQKEKLRQANLGKTHSEETKNKMRLSSKHLSPSEETKKIISLKNSKVVYQYDINHNFIKRYASISEAYQITHISHIAACCHGKKATVGGFIWKFETDILAKSDIWKDVD